MATQGPAHKSAKHSLAKDAPRAQTSAHRPASASHAQGTEQKKHAEKQGARQEEADPSKAPEIKHPSQAPGPVSDRHQRLLSNAVADFNASKAAPPERQAEDGLTPPLVDFLK